MHDLKYYLAPLISKSLVVVRAISELKAPTQLLIR